MENGMNETMAVSEVPEGMHYMAIMGREGDKKTLWSKDNPDEVEAARREFNFLVGEKKYAAFKVEGKKEEQKRIPTEEKPQSKKPKGFL